MENWDLSLKLAWCVEGGMMQVKCNPVGGKNGMNKIDTLQN